MQVVLPVTHNSELHTPNLIDTHAHLDDPKFDNDRGDVIKRAIDAGIEYIITVGTWHPPQAEEKGLEHVTELAGECDLIYTALGVHPHDAKEANDDAFEEIKK